MHQAALLVPSHPGRPIRSSQAVRRAVACHLEPGHLRLRLTGRHRSLRRHVLLRAGHEGEVIHPQGVVLHVSAEDEASEYGGGRRSQLALGEAPVVGVPVQGHGQLRVAQGSETPIQPQHV